MNKLIALAAVLVFCAACQQTTEREVTQTSTTQTTTIETATVDTAAVEATAREAAKETGTALEEAGKELQEEAKTDTK